MWWYSILHLLFAFRLCVGTVLWERKVTVKQPLALFGPSNWTSTPFVFQLYLSIEDNSIRLSGYDLVKGTIEYTSKLLLNETLSCVSTALSPDRNLLLVFESEGASCVAKLSLPGLRPLWKRCFPELSVSRTYIQIKQDLSCSKVKDTCVIAATNCNEDIVLLEFESGSGKVVCNVTYKRTHDELYQIEYVIAGTSQGVIYTYSEANRLMVISKLGNALEVEVSRELPVLNGVILREKVGSHPEIVLVGQKGYDLTTETGTPTILMTISLVDLTTISTRELQKDFIISGVVDFDSQTNVDILTGSWKKHVGSTATLYGIDQFTGKRRWSASFPNYSTILQIISLRPGEYVFVTAGDTRHIMFKYTVHEFVEQFYCHDRRLELCKGCPMGLYWNYTVCSACPRGCRTCVNPEVCTACLNGFRWEQNETRCVKIPKVKSQMEVCDCRSERPECRQNCSLPLCVVDRGSDVTIVQQRDQDGKQTCKCPDTVATNNGSHCFLTTSSNCPPLCSACVRDFNFSYCTECVGGPKVVTHRTSKAFVDCRCEYPYQFNGSECAYVPRTLEKAGAETAPASTTEIVLGIALICAVAVCVVWAMYTFRRRRSGLQHIHSVSEISVTRSQTTEKVQHEISATAMEMTAPGN